MCVCTCTRMCMLMLTRSLMCLPHHEDVRRWPSPCMHITQSSPPLHMLCRRYLAPVLLVNVALLVAILLWFRLF